MENTTGKSAFEVAREYSNVRNRHDTDGLMALLGEDGTSTDPNTISGGELAAYFARYLILC